MCIFCGPVFGGKNNNDNGGISIRRLIWYLIWTVGIGTAIYLGTKLQLQIERVGKNQFQLFPFMLFSVLFPIFIGLLLRLPKLIIEIKEKKPWTFDWMKFVFVALPCLYVVVMSILPFSPLGQGKIPVIQVFFLNGSEIISIAGMILGYEVLDGLKK